MTLGLLFQDIDIYNRTHRSWCCDWCHFESGSTEERITAGFSVLSIILNPVPPTPPPPSGIPKPLPPPQYRTESVSPYRIGIVRFFLDNFRTWVWKELAFPDTTVDVVMPDTVLTQLAENIKRVSSPNALRVEIERAGLKLRFSALSDRHLDAMWLVVEHAMNYGTNSHRCTANS